MMRSMVKFERMLWVDANLQPLLDSLAERAGYDLIDDERRALLAGIERSCVEEDRWYAYEFAGQNRVVLEIARDAGAGLVSFRIGCSAAFKPVAEALLYVFGEYEVVNPHRIKR